MELPDKVRVMGVDYKILRLEHVICDSQLYTGVLDAAKGEIQIIESLSNDRAWITLLHEVIHAIDHNDNLEDEMVENLAWGLYQVFTDNGWFREGG